MKRFFLFYCTLLLCSMSVWGQNENKPVQRKFDVDPASKTLLKIPEDTPLPNYLQKDFLSNTPQPNNSNKGFEKNIQMGFNEQFIDPGHEYLERLQTPEAEKNPGDFKVDQYLGDFKSNAKSVRIVFRDHQHPDGDWGSKHGMRDAYEDPDKIAELIDAGKATVDPDERFEIYSELQQLLYEDPMWVYAAQEGLAYPYRDWLQDFTVNPLWRGPHYEYYTKG